MSPDFRPAEGLPGRLTMLRVETDGPIVHIRLNRPDKRNALSGTLVREIETAFVHLPAAARAAVISGEGAHFRAGLDLSEVTEQTVAAGIRHSRMGHAAFDRVQFGPVPVIAVLHGAAVGAGEGLFVESPMAAIAQGDDAALQRVRDFLDKRAGKVGVRP